MFWNVGCGVSMLDILMMMIGGDGPSRMAGHAMIDEPMYLEG